MINIFNKQETKMNGVTAMDENGEEIKSPIKRLGSTRKLILFNSKYIFFHILKKNSHTKGNITSE